MPLTVHSLIIRVFFILDSKKHHPTFSAKHIAVCTKIRVLQIFLIKLGKWWNPTPERIIG